MNILKSFLRSSADPQKTSLFLKGIATFLVLLGAEATVVQQLNSDFFTLTVKIAEVAALVYSIVGGIRKVKFGRWSAPSL